MSATTQEMSDHSYQHLPSFSEQNKLSIKLQKTAVKAASWQSPESVHIFCCKGFSLSQIHQKHGLSINEVHNSALIGNFASNTCGHMQQTNSSTPLSPEPPPKRPQAFQATPLNSVLMRLESWHGKLQHLNVTDVWNGCKNKPRKPNKPQRSKQHRTTPLDAGGGKTTKTKWTKLF